VQTNAPERPQQPLLMPTIIDHAGAQTKANPNSPSHSPAPTLTAQGVAIFEIKDTKMANSTMANVFTSMMHMLEVFSLSIRQSRS
jgi:hypothetical protein